MSENGFGASDFFYSNLRIQEILTTIRYGIEARKGVVLLVGEPGVGKTTILHRVVAESSANVIFLVATDPRISFGDVLRLMLDRFEADSQELDEPAMVRRCQHELRARLQRCEIVALLFDNAHHLSDQTLRHVIKNFLGGSAEDPEGSLLQLVLAGRPELQTKLAQAALSSAGRRTPVVCEVEALNSQEIGCYIEQRLQTQGQSADLFEARALKRIALYSRGNPRSINALCERALQFVAGSGNAAITAESVDRLAEDLGLCESEAPASPVYVTSRPATADTTEFSPRFQFAQSDDDESTADRVWPDESRGARQRGAQPPRRKNFWIALMLFVIAVAGAAAWMDTETLREVVARWNKIPGIRSAEFPEGTDKFTAGTEPGPKPEAVAPAPAGAAPTDPPGGQSAAAPAGVAAGSPSSDARAGSRLSPDVDSRPMAPFEAERSGSLESSTNPSSQAVRSRVMRAIENRAILGVEVSVVEGVAYLDGRVASERQRRAAERAALSVAEVRQVDNRIVVE